MYMRLVYDNNYGTGTVPTKHKMKTGGQIPVEIMAEIDRKIDDGNPYSGAFQFSIYAPAGSTAPNAATCINGTAWNIVRIRFATAPVRSRSSSASPRPPISTFMLRYWTAPAHPWPEKIPQFLEFGPKPYPLVIVNGTPPGTNPN